MFKIKLNIIKIVKTFVKPKYNTFVYKCKFNFPSSKQLIQSICQISVFFVSLLCIMNNDMNSSLFEIFRICTCFQTIFRVCTSFNYLNYFDFIYYCAVRKVLALCYENPITFPRCIDSFLVGGGLSMLKYVVFVPLQI